MPGEGERDGDGGGLGSCSVTLFFGGRVMNPRCYGTQSARKMLNSFGLAAFRSEDHTNCFPSGENIGKLLKCALKVICSDCVPSSLMTCK